MEIIKVKNWKEPLNDTMYFDCFEYKVKHDNIIYYYETIKGVFTWYREDQVNPTHARDRIDNSDFLKREFTISYPRYLREKKLKRILKHAKS